MRELTCLSLQMTVIFQPFYLQVVIRQLDQVSVGVQTPACVPPAVLYWNC